MSILYATRSILPSKAANSVQSAHMAIAWNKKLPGIPVVYRSGQAKTESTLHFSAYGLKVPSGAVPFKRRLFEDAHHSYLLSFSSFLKNASSHNLVYTRSARMAWVAVKMSREVILELHDPLIPIRCRFLKRSFTAGHLKLLIATTDRLKQDVIEHTGIPEHRIFVAGGAASRDYLELSSAPLEQRPAFRGHIGYAGSALNGKGVEIILQCAEAMPDVAFHILGPSIKECNKIKGVGRIEKNVILHGFLPGHQVIPILKSMDALLLPNQPSVFIRSGADIGQHTSPLKLFEYMACNRPIIASDVSVFRGILRDEENALIVSATNAQAYSQAIERILADNFFASNLASVSLLEFEQKYTWDNRVERIADFMNKNGISLD